MILVATTINSILVYTVGHGDKYGYQFAARRGSFLEESKAAVKKDT